MGGTVSGSDWLGLFLIVGACILLFFVSVNLWLSIRETRRRAEELLRDMEEHLTDLGKRK